ncbi:MAG TPA: Hint domain-containing protein [Acetobacteraceae bacterium]|jgi:hypothetical protein
MASTYSWNTSSTGTWATSTADWTNVNTTTTGTAPTVAAGDLAEITVKTTITVADTTSGAGSLSLSAASGVAEISVSASDKLTITNAGTILSGGKLILGAAGGEASLGSVVVNGGTIAITQATGTLLAGSGGFSESSGLFSPATGVFNDTGNLSVSGGTFSDNTKGSTISGIASFTGGTDSFGGTNSAPISIGTLTVGGASAGKLTLDSGTDTIAGTSATTINSNGTLAMNGGTLVAGSAGITDSGLITGFGALSGGALSGAGSVTASGGTLTINDTDSSALTVANSASNILNLSAAQSGITVSFAGAAGALELSDFSIGTPDSLNFASSTVAGMNVNTSQTATNEIILTGPTESGVKAVFTGSGTSGSLQISDSTGVITTISLTGLIGTTDGAEYANWTGATTTTDIFLSNAVCFGPGTQILTAHGEVAVEALAEGDLVVTHTGEQRPIKWIGYRRMDLTRHSRPSLAAPVRIRRGAFAENLPGRDLIVSPDHCLFVDGKLIPAKLLINDMTVVQERDTRVAEYYHVELDRHAVLLAEGLPAESYLDTGNRAFFSNAGLALVLHPEFHVNAGLRCWETDACAPLAVSAEAVEPVWRDLAARAEMLGYTLPEVATTDDADLRVVANGRTIRPVAANGGCHVFVLPPGASAVRLVSRAGSPSDVVPYLEDWRLLGVAVNRIVVRSSQEQIEIPADHPALTQGWHAIEHEGAAQWRWTDGSARLPIAASTEPLTVEVHVRQTMQYRLETAAPRRLVA